MKHEVGPATIFPAAGQPSPNPRQNEGLSSVSPLITPMIMAMTSATPKSCPFVTAFVRGICHLQNGLSDGWRHRLQPPMLGRLCLALGCIAPHLDILVHCGFAYGKVPLRANETPLMGYASVAGRLAKEVAFQQVAYSAEGRDGCE